MRDQDRGPPGHHLAQGVVNGFLGGGVHRAGGVVEDQDPGVIQQRAGQGDPLTLAAGQAKSPFADHRVVAARQAHDEVVGARGARRRFDVGVAGARAPVADVVPHRLGEQEALLEGDADLAAQRVQGDVPHVMAVDEHGALLRVIEPRHQRCRGRLATSARADDSDARPGRDVQVEAAQDRGARPVGEADAGEGDLAAQLWQLDRAGCVGNGRAQVDELEDALDAGPGLLGDGQDAGQPLGGRDELGDVGGEGQERAQRDLMVQGHPAAEGQHGDLPEDRDGLQNWLVAGLQAHRAHLRAVDGAGRLGHPFELLLLLAEGLDDPDAVEVLVDDLDDVALTLLAVPGGREDLPAHPVGHHQQQRRDDEADDGQQRAQDEHDPDRQHHQQDVAAHDREVVEQPLDQGGVGIGPPDELARRHLLEVLRVHGLEVTLHVAAQVVLDLQGHPAAVIAAEIGKAERGGGERDEQGQPGPQGGGMGQDDAVDDLPLDQGHGGLADAAENRAEQRELQPPAVPEHVARQAPDPARAGWRWCGHWLSFRLAARRSARRLSMA